MDEKQSKNNEFKGKAIAFVVGLLTGAVIATGAIYLYTVAEGNAQTNATDPGQMGGGQQGGQMNDGGTPPELPSGQQSGQVQAN